MMNNFIIKLFIPLLIASAFCSCSGQKDSGITLLPEENFTKLLGQEQISLFTLKNGDIVMQVTNFGARVVSLWLPDRNGKYDDVVLGYDHIDKYLHNPGERFLGAAVGPVANRLGEGKYTIDGKVYNFPQNDHDNTLHGGDKGLDMVVWKVDDVDDNSIAFSYTHKDGQEGFPGNKTINMVYTLTEENQFEVSYKVTTDEPTHINLSHHSFFNLHGEGEGTILDHEMVINGAYITEIGPSLIPTGEMLSVEGTPFDFRTAHVIGERIGEQNVQLENGHGYDHNWLLDKKEAGQVEFAASLYEPTSGRMMKVYTDQPGLQFYSGNFFDGSTSGKSGKSLDFRASLALETQFFPDAANQTNFPSTLLLPGNVYTHKCIYEFSSK